MRAAAWLLAAAGALFAGAASGQGDPLDQARQRMAANDPKGAYALLAPLEAARAGQPDFDYLLGIAALDSGQPTRAIFALERVLAVQPGNALARAEIGRAYLAAGEAESARVELAQVRASPIPDAAVPAVDRLLNAIGQLQAQQTTQVRGYVEAGLGYDSNVNSATGASQIAVPAFGGAILTLDPASTRLSDSFAAIGGGISVRVPIAPDLAFSGSLAANQIANRQQDQFDLGTLEGSAGLSKTLGNNVLSAAVQANSAWVGGSRFRDAYGMYGQWQHNYSVRAQSSLFAQFSRLEYPDQSIRDADRWVLGAGYAQALGGTLPTVFASGYFGREDARAANVPQLSHELAGLRLGAQWQASDAWNLFTTLSYEKRDYGGTDPLFDQERADRQTSLTLGAQYVVAPGWRLTPQLFLTDNNSNIEIYAFRRAVASVTLRREF